VLVISLVILMVMTLIGVTAMQNTTLGERMASNARQRNLAFQAAETALRTGETVLQVPPLPTFNPTQGLFPWVDPPTNPALTTPLDSATYWMGYDWDNQSQQYTGTLGGSLSSPPRYVIEQLTFTVPPLEADKPGSSELWYRVTARGVSGTGDAIVILQSLYRPPY